LKQTNGNALDSSFHDSFIDSILSYDSRKSRSLKKEKKSSYFKVTYCIYLQPKIITEIQNIDDNRNYEIGNLCLEINQSKENKSYSTNDKTKMDLKNLEILRLISNNNQIQTNNQNLMNYNFLQNIQNLYGTMNFPNHDLIGNFSNNVFYNPQYLNLLSLISLQNQNVNSHNNQNFIPHIIPNLNNLSSTVNPKVIPMNRNLDSYSDNKNIFLGNKREADQVSSQNIENMLKNEFNSFNNKFFNDNSNLNDKCNLNDNSYLNENNDKEGEK